MEYSFNNICPYCFTQKGFSVVCPHCGYEEKPSALVNHIPARTLLQQRYLIGALIGVGGFGLVYKAFDLRLNRVVAIKELFPPMLVNRIAGQCEVLVTSERNIPQFNYMLERFRLETRFLSRMCGHPHIVQVFDSFETNNTAYFVMEFLDGVTLDKKGRVSVLEALKIADAVLDALEPAHSSGVIHRDVKPSNIFVCRDGSIKLIDFGAAKFEGFADNPRMICAKVFSDGFSPPEQFRDETDQGPCTDIYAVGATLYCILSGKVPLPSTDIAMGVKLPPLSREVPGVPAVVERAIALAMSIDERLRFQSTGEFRKALSGKVKVRSEAEERRHRRRVRRIAAFALIAALGAAVAGGWYYLDRLRSSDSALGRITADEEISVVVRVDEDELDTMQTIADSLEDGFAAYAADITDYELELSIEVAADGSGSEEDAPVLMCGEDFENPAQPDWLGSLLSDSYMFSPDDPDGFVSAFDIDVLYVNLKLLEEKGADSSVLTSMDTLRQTGEIYTDGRLFGSYDGLNVSPDALERFCSGEILFCAARASDIQTVSEALPGYCHAVAMPGGRVPAGYIDVWQINGDATENQRNAAQVFLSYLAGDEAQDIICLQNRRGIPANETIYELYRSYHPELSDILDDRESFVYE